MNIDKYWDSLLAAMGDSTGAQNEHDFQTKHIAAATSSLAGKVDTSTIAPLGGTITGATANDTMTAVADIALSTSDTYTDAAVNAAVNAAIAEIEDNFADLQTKVNAIITALA